MGVYNELDAIKRYKILIDRDGTNLRDQERLSLLWILAANDDLYRKSHHIYDYADHSINVDCLASSNVDFCSSSKALIRLGYNLYNGYRDDYTDPLSLLSNLDDQNIDIAYTAIDIRLGKVSMI